MSITSHHHREVAARRVFTRVWVAFTLLLFVNELGTNVFGLMHKFSNAKVLNSLTDEAREALTSLGFEVALMLALALLLTALLALPWASVITTVFLRWRTRHGELRAARWMFWAVAGFCFLHVWYSLHNILLPSSRMTDSPLVILGGSFDSRLLPWTSVRMLVLPVTLLALGGATVWALLKSARLRKGFALGALALALAVPGYSHRTGVGEVRQFTAPGSVVVLGVDSLQMNRLPLGGGQPGLAPNMNAFLEQSHRFENAWTPFARTYPSWVSMFTGRYPVRHGVRFNLVPDEHLDSGNRYLADELTRQGYETLHATDETRFSIIRENFGFDHMLHPRMGLADFLVGGFFDFSAANFARQTALGHDLFPLIANNRAVVGYDPQLWVRSFLREVNHLPADEPLFITAHLCGNHWPFSAPYPYWSDDPVNVEGCIAMVDDQVGEIVEYLDASGLTANSTVFLLSDHGDGWSGDPEDTTNTHGDHLDSLLANKVVLGMRRPGLEPGVSMELVRTIDLYPTVLELAGTRIDPAGIDGRSLLPLLDDEWDPPRTCFAESGFDKKTFLVSRLIEEHSDWYDFDPETELITLQDEGIHELFGKKSYMYMQDDLRLVLTPERARFRVTRFDPITGRDHPVGDEVPEAVRREMLDALLDHYDLDRPTLLGLAHSHGFLEAEGSS